MKMPGMEPRDVVPPCPVNIRLDNLKMVASISPLWFPIHSPVLGRRESLWSRKPNSTVGMLCSFQMLSPWNMSDLKLGLGSQLYHGDPLLC